MRSAILLLALLVILPACATQSPRSSRAVDPLDRRAANIRAIADAQWEAIRQAHAQGEDIDSRFVFGIAELRIGAIRSQTMALIGTPRDRAETEAWLDEAEEILPRLLALRLPTRSSAATAQPRETSGAP